MQVCKLKSARVLEMKCSVLLAAIVALLLLAAGPAFAVQIFVSNEKDNTVPCSTARR